MVSRNAKIIILASIVVVAVVASVGFASKVMSIDSVTSATSRPPTQEATVVIRPENSPRGANIDVQLETDSVNLSKGQVAQIRVTVISDDDRTLPLQVRVFNDDSEEGRMMAASELEGLPNGLPDGIIVTPDVTKLKLDAHGRAQVVVNIRATSDAPAGTYNIGVTARVVVGVIEGTQVEDGTTDILRLTVS